jgi:hypothetical protein
VTDKTEVMENCLYRLKDRRGLSSAQISAIDDFMADVGADALADLYDLVRHHDGGPTTLVLDTGMLQQIDRLAKLRAAIADHR